MLRLLRLPVASVCLFASAVAGPLRAQDSVSYPPRPATQEDVALLGRSYGAVRAEFARMGLRQTIGHTCRVFVTADSIRPNETPLPLGGSTVTLPYASFLTWAADRPFADAVLYHVFAAAEAAYTADRPVPPDVTGAAHDAVVRLAPREPFPAAASVANDRDALAGGPFRRGATSGATAHLEVKPYLLPTQNDDPASVLPRKQERVLQVTCLSDPDRVTNCLCAGTD